ncbi:hypothetical protein ACSFA3_10715 [Variovorax sp. RHLX14]|uniref:hypothetical protein n=1 Tax=Variovorax sp. RHLX14 TaxID=1259731 RepID=UPI003F471F79
MRHWTSVFHSIAILALSLAAISVPASAADTPTPFKITLGSYSVAGGALPAGPGLDVNLRYTYGSGNVWLGWFRSPALDFSQLRGGWDHVFSLGPVRVLPSLQSASGGFVGGSLAIETGDRWFAGIGLGRTNLHAYANLNFDPNDSFTVYGGCRWDEENTVTVQLIRDNRDNPDQQHVHLIWRKGLSEGRQLVFDLLEKQGTVENRFVRRTGLSVGYDWPVWSVRAAWDPKVNFTPQNMVRLSLARRF